MALSPLQGRKHSILAKEAENAGRWGKILTKISEGLDVLSGVFAVGNFVKETDPLLNDNTLSLEQKSLKNAASGLSNAVSLVPLASEGQTAAFSLMGPVTVERKY